MKVKDQVLSVLEENRGVYISGEALAKELSVSRNAIWKAIRQLQESGHTISAVPNRGYLLSEENNVLSPQSIGQYLTSGPLNLEVYEELTSTNTLLRKQAEEGAPEGTVVFAETQTAGKGRLGRSFHSPPGGGVYMSLLLRPPFTAQESLCITTCAAVAVCRAIEKHTQVKSQIKWVNDVFCHGKKVCGISTEASLDLETGGLHYAILGIGLNIFPGKEPFPAELDPLVGTILPAPIPGLELRSILAAEILNCFLAEYPTLTQKAYFNDYRARCMVLGKPIDILRNGTRQEAVALDLEPDFRLRVRLPDGSTEALSSGEVSIRLKP
jgi:BirA family biotin operon repressor/biotin-[acetyl-CoA-carboxylase] ligase